MLQLEAAAIGEWIRQIDLPKGAVCLNIGSSTKEFREVTQPHISEHIFVPLGHIGVKVVNVDMKKDEGVDEVGDILNPEFRETLRSYQADIVICSNLLEHLHNPNLFTEACGDLVKVGGYCLITVPRSFPYHPDPIDTMFRPVPETLVELLPSFETVAIKDLRAGSYRDDLASTGRPYATLARQFLRAMMPFYKPNQWWPAAHKLVWIFRPYRVSMALLRKPML